MEAVIVTACREDALEARRGGARVLSVKNLREGSLGANIPRTIREVRKAVPRRVAVGASLGDFPERMAGTAAQAAIGAIVSGARHHVTAGLCRVSSKEEASLIIRHLGEIKDLYPRVMMAIGVYADYERLGTIGPTEALELLKGSRIDAVVLDVQFPEEAHLFQLMKPSVLQEFVGRAHRYGLRTILLGSLGVPDVEALIEIGTDLIGVRGSVCEGGRTGRVSAQKVRELLRTIEHQESLYSRRSGRSFRLWPFSVGKRTR
jgi:uncharacterized protein (UPF0264 family)